MDLVNRHFSTFAPNELWVAGMTYVHTFSGWVYARVRDGRVLAPDHRLANLDLAVADKLIPVNPAAGVPLPRPGKILERRYLTHEEVARVAAATP